MSVVVLDRDEYTPGERRRIDAQLAKSLSEYKHGKSYGPFKTHEEMTAFLQAKKSPTKAKRAPKRRAK